VPDIYHPKVIWWKGYGAYIGSANLTERGWFGNIEAGIFLSHHELVENDFEDELTNFFDELDTRSSPLTQEIYDELCNLESANNRIDVTLKPHDEKFRKLRKLPTVDPLIRIVKRSSSEKRRNAFILEWNETLQLLRDIADRVSTDKYRPDWVNSHIPKGVQADQFLHAYYYSNVRKGTRALHHEFHDKNLSNPEKALVDAMQWWKSLKDPPNEEDRTIDTWAPYLKEKLGKNKLQKLSEEDFIEVCEKVHAMRDHSLRVKYTEFNLDKPLPSMNIDQRIEFFSKWLFKQTSETGKRVLDTISFVLYDGEPEKLPDRLWQAIVNTEWLIPHLGVSSLGEMVGWAMPDIFPPRNGRTSKALYALGYKVRIHSE
jgi:hypothetical protein